MLVIFMGGPLENQHLCWRATLPSDKWNKWNERNKIWDEPFYVWNLYCLPAWFLFSWAVWSTYWVFEGVEFRMFEVTQQQDFAKKTDWFSYSQVSPNGCCIQTIHINVLDKVPATGNRICPRLQNCNDKRKY